MANVNIPWLGYGPNYAGPSGQGGFGYPGPSGGYASGPSPYYWWGAPMGWSDLDLYDYNSNFILDDEEIGDIVRDNIQSNPFIPPSDANNITIDVKDGVVTLGGTVRNPRSKPLAYSDGFWSSGVVDLISNIQVQAPQRREKRQTVKEEIKRKGGSYKSQKKI